MSVSPVQDHIYHDMISDKFIQDIVPALIQTVKVEGLVLVSEMTDVSSSRDVKPINITLDGVLMKEGILCFSETIDM